MNIIISGCGKIGSTILESLVNEGHDVTAIDISGTVIEELSNVHDVIGISGNCTDCDTLKDARIEDAELYVAVTGSDETNMLSCFMAKRMGAENTLFSVPASSIDTPLKYQVIIDFADSEGCSGENITTTFSADVSADDKSNGAPDFPASSLVSQLKDIASSSVVVTDSEEDTMQKNLHIEYLTIDRQDG